MVAVVVVVQVGDTRRAHKTRTNQTPCSTELLLLTRDCGRDCEYLRVPRACDSNGHRTAPIGDISGKKPTARVEAILKFLSIAAS